MTAASDRPVLALDIGGTKIAAAAVRGAEVADRRQAPTPRTGRGADLVAALADLAAPLLGRTRGLAVATTGIVDGGRLTALNPGTLPIEDRFPLAGELAARLGRPAALANDAQAAALGEHRFGAGRGTRDFAFLTVSTGIGGGLVLGGRLLVGRRGLAGHLGHMVADPAGPACGCGRRGCIEAMASGTAIAAEASRRLGREVDAVEAFSLAAAGDAGCEALIEEAAGRIAGLAADLAAAVEVEAVAIGGGVGLAPGFVERIRRHVEAAPPTFRVAVLPAALGADAGLVGAAALMDD